MRKTGRLLMAMILAAGVAGCGSMAGPNWQHPGTAPVQQSRAERFDPYPENEIGPPIVGARPREFQQPPGETSRARQTPWSWGF
jgi:hypothetical protein